MGSKRPLLVRAASRLVRPLGYAVVARGQWNRIDVAGTPRTLIDVGCATDTPQFRNAFPEARLLLVDPVREYEPQMRAAVERRGGAYAIVAAGSRRGTLRMQVNVDDPEKSSAYDRTALAAKSGRVETRECPVATIDELVAEHAAEPPFGLKIDTEGNELEVVRGAARTLSDCLFVIAEASVQPRFVGSYRFEQLIREMDEVHGFEVRNILAAEPDGNRVVRSVDVLFTPRETSAGQPRAERTR